MIVGDVVQWKREPQEPPNAWPHYQSSSRKQHLSELELKESETSSSEEKALNMTQEAIQTPVLKEHEESMRGKRKQVGKLATGSTLITNQDTKRTSL